jgi:hypothetical protein
MNKLLEFRCEDAFHKDDAEFALADTIDVKASVLLAVLAFAAILDRDLLLTPNLALWGKYSAIMALAALIGSAVWAMAALKAREYKVTANADVDEDWIARVLKSLDGEEDIEERALLIIREGRLKKAIERAVANRIINSQRASQLGWSYRFLTAGLALTLIGLVSFCSRVAIS